MNPITESISRHLNNKKVYYLVKISLRYCPLNRRIYNNELFHSLDKAKKRVEDLSKLENFYDILLDTKWDFTNNCCWTLSYRGSFDKREHSSWQIIVKKFEDDFVF
tara:strand:- start:4048 stop:4365 length:318 start_codon:yes stop_codon:yes gene_type:complete